MPSLSDITLASIMEGLDKGIFNSVHLVKAYVARIKEVDHTFRSVIELNPKALDIAHQLDMERRISGRRGPLHGVPILLKDHIVTLDSMESTSGSYALLGSKPAKEASVVTALRKAGAIILGKANLAEWVGLRSTDGSTGWSPRGGQATGIFYPNMKALGSSTGSAISTSLGLTFASFGTETISGIVGPAERSGVIGFKPTRELIPSEGIIYGSQRQDTLGILTRTVQDAANILKELLRQMHNATTSETSEDLRQELVTKLELRGIRIGIPGNINTLQNLHSVKQEAFEKSVDLLERAGAEIVREVALLGAEEYENLPRHSKQIVLDTDMKINLNTYFARLQKNPQNITNLQDLIDLTKSCNEEEYPRRNVEAFQRAQATDAGDELYKEMLAKDTYFSGAGGIQGALNRHNLHVLLMPTATMTISIFAAKAGSPVMPLTLGYYPPGTKVKHDENNGLVTIAPNIPLSAYIYGKPYADHDIPRVGHAFESLTRVRDRLRPYKVPRIDLVDIVTASGPRSHL